MPAAAYIRVSTKSQGTDLQHHAIQAAAAARGDDITLIYEERRSGKTTARPELQRMLQDARAGRLPPRLYVFRYDRLSRGKIAELLGMVNELRQVGVQIISVKDEVTLSGPIGEFVLAGMALAAAIELSAGEDRRAGAREAREARGLSFGRPRRLDKPGAEGIAERISTLRAEGRTLRQIAQATGIKRDTVRRTLERLERLAQKSPPDPTPLPASQS